jgi:NAD(P)H dehydrogenase (quinone)
MYAVMGSTGQVGGAVADALLRAGQPVRAIVRDSAKADSWRARGATTALADFGDAPALAAALADVEAAFVMLPANFAPAPDFAEPRAFIDALRRALMSAGVPKVVALSSVGAQHDRGLGLITQLHLLERMLRDTGLTRALLRPAWFMENARWDIASARADGSVASYLQPLDRAIPMVATGDIGTIAADVLQQSWHGERRIEIEGPTRCSPNDIARAIGARLGHEVRANIVERAQWAERFADEGTPRERSGARIDMLDGFNSGWIDFEVDGCERRSGRCDLATVVSALVVEASPA